MTICNTCRHFDVSELGDAPRPMCWRSVPRAGRRDTCSEYRIDPASEPPEDEEPADVDW